MAKTKQQRICDYLASGWAVVPLIGKAPTIKDWPHLVVSPTDVPSYFGTGSNVGIILGERSGWLVDIDLDHDAAVRAAAHFLPATDFIFGRASNRRSHHIYVAPDSVMHAFKTAEDGSLVELRASGQTMFPPSIHPSGEPVELEGERGGSPPTPAMVDANSLEEAVRCTAAAALVGIHWPAKGNRHDAGLALAGGLLNSGWSLEETQHFVRAVCAAACDEETADRTTAVGDTMRRIRTGANYTGWPRLAELIGTYVVDKAREWLKLPRTSVLNIIASTAGVFSDNDVGNGERLAARHSEKLRYVWVGRGGYWLVWSGKRWRESHMDAVMLAKETARSIYAEAHARADEDHRERGLKWANQSESAAKINAMLDLARSEPTIAATPDLFDRSPWLLNLENGTLDLQEYPFVLRPHAPEQYLTKLANCSYDPDARSPVWDKTIDRAFAGDLDLIAYLQAIFGYSLTGITNEQKFWICWGTGANGKSTILGSVSHILGDYAQQASSSTFLLGKTSRSGDIPRSDLAATRGVRLLCATELAQEQRLDDALVKLFTGGEQVVARRLYQSKAMVFTPEFKLLLSANHKPVFLPDNAMARRIRLIPFTVTIPLSEQDSELSEKLRADASGILNFCLTGFQNWHRLSWLSQHEPAAVQSATSDYLRELDPLTPFLDECCEFGPLRSHRTQASKLYRAFKEFAAIHPEYGGEHDSTVVFGRRMQDAGSRNGAEKRKVHGIIVWYGIRLKSAAVGQPAPDEEDGGRVEEGLL